VTWPTTAGWKKVTCFQFYRDSQLRVCLESQKTSSLNSNNVGVVKTLGTPGDVVNTFFNVPWPWAEARGGML
jgi:hypothetical protein